MSCSLGTLGIKGDPYLSYLKNTSYLRRLLTEKYGWQSIPALDARYPGAATLGRPLREVTYLLYSHDGQVVQDNSLPARHQI